MYLMGGHVRGIARGEVVDAVAELHLAVTAQHDHEMLVSVVLQGGVAARRDLEVTHVKGRGLAALADQRLPRDAAMMFGRGLVLGDGNAIPAAILSLAHHTRGRRSCGRCRAGFGCHAASPSPKVTRTLSTAPPRRAVSYACWIFS